MEPLSVTSGIIAVLQLSAEVVKYIGAAAGASDDRKRLRSEVRACEHVLQELKDDADASEEGSAWAETIEALEAPEGPLARLSVALDMLRAKLEPKERLKGFLMKLKWPFDESQVNKIIAMIEREKILLGLALSNNCRKLTEQIRKSSKQNGTVLAELAKIIQESSADSTKQFVNMSNILIDIQGSQSGIKDGVDELRQQQSKEERLSILNWLTSVDYAPQHNDFGARRQSETGNWLLESSEFTDWLASDRQTLFCPGIPGAGKTILASIVIDYLSNLFRGDRSVGVAYMYCNFRSQAEQNVENLLANLLKQLSEQLDEMPFSVKELYTSHKEKRTRPGPNELLSALQSVAAMYSRIFIVLDALDECQRSHRTQLILQFQDMQMDCGVNIFATSRVIPEIVNHFKGCASLEIRASDEDVRKYIEGQISHLPACVENSRDLQAEVKEKIVRAVDGMFLLAQLHLNSLKGKRSPKAIRKALDKLPTGSEAYDHAYSDAMERIEGQLEDEEQLAKQVLAWIVCAKRSLTTSELEQALAVEVGEAELDVENICQAEDMVAVCAGLVTVDEETGIIRLVHYTTQEYFDRTQGRWFPAAHTEIARICISYLSFDVFGTGFCYAEDMYNQRLQLNLLFDYAARNWGYHAREAEDYMPVAMEFLRKIRNVKASSEFIVKKIMSLEHAGYRQSPHFTAVHLAVYFGAEEIVRNLMEEKFEFDLKDIFGRTPLLWAAEKGYQVIVQILLERGAEVESEDKAKRTSLLWAAGNGYENVVELLLRYGANIDSGDWVADTPLLKAAENGHIATVRLLLENGAAADPRTLKGHTPLWRAASRGHRDVVDLLIKNGAEVDPRSLSGKSALTMSAISGHEAVARLLIENGGDVNSKDEGGQTPLLYAAVNGHEAVIKLLLEKGAALESSNGDGQTSLSLSASGGHDAVVKLLLDEGAYVDPKDSRGRRPLSWIAGRDGQLTTERIFRSRESLSVAASIRHTTVAKLLLERGAETNAKDDGGRTALFWAAKDGLHSLVEVMIDHGADVDSEDIMGQTPLSCAARNAHVAVVKLLLERGASIHSKNNKGQTPLSLAAAGGSALIVELLLDKGAKDDISNGSQQTPLSLAAQNGHEAVVRILLARDVTTDSQNSSGQTPLSLAAQNGHETVARLLLAKGANMDSADRRGKTPLSYAAERGYAVIVRLLLERGAIIENRDKKGLTPLLGAARDGYKDTIELLLDGGAAINVKDNHSITALLYAVSYRHKTTSVLELLLDRGVVVDARDFFGQTSLSHAAGGGQEAEVNLLLEAGADVDSRDHYGRTTLWYATNRKKHAIIQILRDKGATNDSGKFGDRTPLWYAASSGDAAEVERLLDASAEVDFQDCKLRTPLYLAVEHRHYEVAELLLQRGAQVDLKDSYNRTPLTVAARYRYKRIATLLLSNNADIDNKDSFGQTPLSWSINVGHESIQQLLEDGGAQAVRRRLWEDSTSTDLWDALEFWYNIAICTVGEDILFGRSC